MKKHLHTLDINKDTPAEPLPPAIRGGKKYHCDACKVTFDVLWGKHCETCPCCDNYCDQVKE